MADETGKGAYGTRHVMEERMRAKGMGVFANKAAPAPDNKSLEDMTKAELVELAESKGVEVFTSDTKAEIIAKLG